MKDSSRFFGPFGGKGLSVWLVGGAVRDAALDLAPGDLDLVVDLSMEEIAAICGGAVVGPEGMQVCITSCDEFVMEVCPLRGGSIENDLSVRDFTVNAMALTEEGTLVDPFDGMEDLKSQVLCFVGDSSERLEEDPIRALRMCRLASSLGMTPSVDSLRAVRKFVATRPERLEALSCPRVGKEMVVGLVRPVTYLSTMMDVGLVRLLMPSLDHGLALSVFSVLAESRGEVLPLEMALAVLAGLSRDDQETPSKRWISWGVARSIRREAERLARFRSVDPDSSLKDMGEMILDYGDDIVLKLFELSSAWAQGCGADVGRWRDGRSRLDEAIDHVARAFEKGIVPDGSRIGDLVGEGPQVKRCMVELYRSLASGNCSAEEDAWEAVLTGWSKFRESNVFF